MSAPATPPSVPAEPIAIEPAPAPNCAREAWERAYVGRDFHTYLSPEADARWVAATGWKGRGQ